ncbi:PqqD family peptide modification chaperone [Planktotalea sp.]|uniref:PqqD family peptide modification chaperone n=1 Tax=Planktotalea sp. TaxID=2029877 RepID=UPI003D6A29DE
MKADLNTLVLRSQHILASDLDDEVVMMDVESGSYFSMPGPAGRIWNLLETEQTIKSLTETLISEYDVSAEQCEAEVLPFVNSLIERDLIILPNGENK